MIYADMRSPDRKSQEVYWNSASIGYRIVHNVPISEGAGPGETCLELDMRTAFQLQGRIFFAANATQALRATLDALPRATDIPYTLIWHRGLEHPVITQFIGRFVAINNNLRFGAVGRHWPLPSAEEAMAEIDHQVERACVSGERVIVLMSQVHWLTGDLLPVAVLAKAVKLRTPNAVIIVDGAQGPGNLNPAATVGVASMIGRREIEAYFGCFHKWLDATRTTGFVMVSDAFRDSRSTDWLYVNDYLGAAAHSTEDNARFVGDTFAAAAAAAAIHALQLHISAEGAAAINRRRQNAMRLRDLLIECRCGRLISGAISGECSNIIALFLKEKRVASVKDAMRALGITCSCVPAEESGHVFRFSSPDVDVDEDTFQTIRRAICG